MNESTLIICLVNVLTILVGIFVASVVAYGKRKGEIGAENENFRTLLEQVKETTEAQKRIEAKISDDVWDRQKQWEMKRDAAFDVIKSLGVLKNALRDLLEKYLQLKHSGAEQYRQGLNVNANRDIEEALRHFVLCKETFDVSQSLAALLVSTPLRTALEECIGAVLVMRAITITPELERKWPQLQLELDQKISAVYELARNELGIKATGQIIAKN
ncbi:MAG: hypothetical protein ACRD3N_16930 [Terracidiphilus sp.]